MWSGYNNGLLMNSLNSPNISVREPIDTIAGYVKSKPLDRVKESLNRYTIKAKLMAHQYYSVAAALGSPVDSYLLFLETGTGKSCIALTLFSILHSLGKAKRCLIIANPPVSADKWLHKEVKTFTDFYDKSRIISNKTDMKNTNDSVIDVVSHFKLIQYLKDNDISMDYDCVIFDECHIAGNPESVGFLQYRRAFSKIKYKYLLTGTPISNDYKNIWSLYCLIDNGKTFGDNYYKFLMKYFRIVQRKRKIIKKGRTFYSTYNDYIIKKKNLPELLKKFWTYSIRFNIDECIDICRAPAVYHREEDY